jgi:signal transduction histidine kinase
VRVTLRTRATLLATAITVLILALGSVALVLTLEARLSAGADDLARARVRDLLTLASAGQLPDTVTTLDEGIAQVVTADGRVLASSPNVPGRLPIAGFDPGGRLAVRTVDAPDDAETETYRLWAGTGDSPDGPVTVYVGTSLEAVHEASAALRRALWLGVPVVALLLAVGTWLVVGATLRRMDRIRAEVDTITEAHLDRRVPGSGVGDEVGLLATTMNRMLDRLEASARRERDFVADVSHDLQSPLAAQRAQLEVALAHPDSREPAELARDLLEITTQMERLVGDLLVLAAADADAGPPDPTALDLEDVVLEEAARARAGSALRIDTGAVTAAPVRAHRSDVQRIVRNLLENALAHAGAQVQLRVSLDADEGRLDVLDDGPGVPDEDRDRIFDRFQRGDRARSRHAVGSGLGLAIARTLAERAGGTLELAASGSGAHFVLRLPGTGR